MGNMKRNEQTVVDQDGNENSRIQAMKSTIKNALNALDYTQDTTDILTSAYRSFTVEIPITMDDGSIRIFKGYRSQHIRSSQPSIGSVILHPNLDEQDVQALAMKTSLHTGLLNIPYSGASGAIICNPSELSFHELEQLSRGYIRALLPLMNATKDIITPDVPTPANLQLMAWMHDEVEMIRPDLHHKVVAGLPESLGGVPGREHSVAKGAKFTIERAAERLNMSVQDANIIVHGFGNTGVYLARELENKEANVIGVSDGHGALYDQDGLDVDYLLDRRDSFGMVTNLFKKSISTERLLGSKCDILVDASLDKNVMTEQVADTIQAKLVVETAKQTLSESRVDQLFQRGSMVVPEIMTNLGNLTLSHFEAMQHEQRVTLSESEINAMFKDTMYRVFDQVFEEAKQHNTNMREAAARIGIKRHAEALNYRGLS